MLLTTAGATASQISLVPLRALDRWRSLQLRPPPLTEVNACFAVELPPDIRKATISSPVCEVVIAGELMLDDAVA